MRKITFLLSFMVALGLSAQTNLVKNPSFESDFADWSKGPITSYTAPTVMTGGAQNGEKYVEYKPTATTGFYQDIPVTAGKTYKLSFWYKATGDNTDARLWSNFKNGADELVYLGATAAEDPLRTNDKYLPTATEWTEHTVEFVAPAGVVLFQLAVRAYNKSTVAYDNFSLIELGGEAVPTMSVTPKSLSFTTTVGTTATAQTITVSATNLTAVPTVTITGTDAAMFAQTGTLTVDGGTLSVTFTPTSTGAKSATLTITSGELTESVELTGTVTDASNPYGLDDSAPLKSLNEVFADATQLPAGWKSASDQGDREWGIKSYGGNNYAQMTAFGGTGKYQTLLISPAIDFDSIDKANVKFDWKSGYTNGAELKVYVMSIDGAKTEVKAINDNTNPEGYGTFNTETLDLSAFSGVKFLVFEYIGDADNGQTTTYQVDNVIAVATSGTGLVSTKYETLKLWSADGKVMFTAAAGETVEVYNTVGQRMYSALATEGQNEISLNQRGIVIVKVGNRVGKLIL